MPQWWQLDLTYENAFFNGGHGEQVFQHIVYRFIEENCDAPVYLDNRCFYNAKVHNGYELERVFGVKPNLFQAILNQMFIGVLCDKSIVLCIIKDEVAFRTQGG